MKKRALLTVLCAILLVVATIMGTMAYLTDTKEVKNTFTVGKVYIDLNETDVDENGVVIPSASPVKENSYKLLPGHTYTKDPTVTVLADSEDCYVKMTMSIDKIDKIDAIFATSKEGKADLTAIFTGYNADWELKSTTDKDNVRTYEFWYKNKVAKNASDQKLAPLFTNLVVPGFITNQQIATINGMNITINAYAIQADGFNDDMAAAWAAFPEA